VPQFDPADHRGDVLMHLPPHGLPGRYAWRTWANGPRFDPGKVCNTTMLCRRTRSTVTNREETWAAPGHLGELSGTSYP